VDLAIVVDGNHTDRRDGLGVSSQQHATDGHASRVERIREQAPSVIEVGEVDAVEQAIAAGRADRKAGGPDGTDGHESQHAESNQGLLLSQLVNLTPSAANTEMAYVP
jgi:hypothetical protein